MIRRASTRKSLLASGLKASLNDLTGSEIYDNADLSESVYTDDEDDINDYSKRTTVKPGQFTLPPLNLDSRKSAAREKRRSKRDSQPKKKDRELKRTSEREPTPHYLAREHGGKENMSSTYSLGKMKITPIPEAKATPRAALSPVRTNAARRSSQTLALPRRSALRDTPLSRAHSPAPSIERHSRRSLHSRQHSLTSAAKRTPHTKTTHSRTQSSAFPFFDPSSPAESSPGSIPATSPTPAPHARMGASRQPTVSRDLSGNLVFHGDETLPNSSSVVFTPPPKGPPSAPLPQLQLGKRVSNVPSGVPGSRQSRGLGLFPQALQEREVLASVGGDGEGAGAGTSAGTEKETAVKEKGRRTWGEGMKSALGRGSVWGWERERDDVKVFV